MDVRQATYLHPLAEEHRGAHTTLLVLPYGAAGRAVKLSFGPGLGPHVAEDPDELRHWAAVLLRWADDLEAELALPPRGQIGML